MLNRRQALLTSALTALSLSPAFSQAPTLEGKVIKVIVPFAAGSATDIIARVVSEPMGRAMNATFVIENRAGANGLLGADAVAKAAPDGLTLLFGTNSTNAAANALFKNVPFDFEKDFAPISYVGLIPLLVCVPASSPFKTLKDLVAKAKETPSALNFASASSSQRFSTEMLASAAGVKFNLIPYRASPQAATDLIAGRLDLFTADLALMLPHVQGGALRALAVTAQTRIPQLPDVPTVNEALGVKDYELIAFFALFAPAKTPDAFITRLNQEVAKAIMLPEVQERLVKGLGMTLKSSSPKELGEIVRVEAAKWNKAAVDAGIEKQ